MGIKQPANTKYCGQCCLATILSIPLQEAFVLVGHKHSTHTSELIKHLSGVSGKLRKQTLPSFALCRVHFNDTKQTHWILYKQGQVYDPIIGFWVRYEAWQKGTAELGARITTNLSLNEFKG
jgi:hypothetical protein